MVLSPIPDVIPTLCTVGSFRPSNTIISSKSEVQSHLRSNEILGHQTEHPVQGRNGFTCIFSEQKITSLLILSKPSEPTLKILSTALSKISLCTVCSSGTIPTHVSHLPVRIHYVQGIRKWKCSRSTPKFNQRELQVLGLFGVSEFSGSALRLIPKKCSTWKKK